ncbi:C40 family peptidase [Nocardioides cheoyonin]|uniref:C40 family peptidase n=1 Tax=Nocardioides cheoyonin TaxID=3156615 RepID=UPI0032B494B6
MLNGRKRLVAGLAAAAVVGVSGMIPAPSAQAKPSIKDVQQRVDTLYHQAEEASEHYNNAKLRLKDLRSELKDLKADQRRQTKALSGIREQLRDSVLEQFEGSGISAVGQAAFSSDPKEFLAGMTTVSAYNSVQGDLLDRYNTEVSALDIRRKATQKRADQVAETEKQLKDDKDAIDDKLSSAKGLLANLKEEERQEILSRNEPRVPTSDVPVSGRAGAAVSYAMAQVGKAYVYGAAGPSAFDCSGLTMMAWAQAGVALPHSSSAQYGTGPHIAESDLRPGDLVFYYSPISHVGMYIGNGLIVNAENPSVGVKVTSLHSMPYVGAVRPG